MPIEPDLMQAKSQSNPDLWPLKRQWSFLSASQKLVSQSGSVVGNSKEVDDAHLNLCRISKHTSVASYQKETPDRGALMKLLNSSNPHL